MIYVCSLKVDNRDLLSGKEVILTLQDLYKVMWHTDTTDIEIRDDFAKEFFTPSGMVAFLEELKKVNPYVRVTTGSNFGTYYDKMAEEVRRINNPEDLMKYILKNRKEAIRMLHHLIDHYSESHTESLVANNKLGTMHLEIAELKRLLEIERVKGSLTLDDSHRTRTVLDTLISRINHTYDKGLDIESFLGLDAQSNRYSKILYIKEITRVHYVDTFIYYLQEILKTLYEVPCRMVVIEAAFAYKRANLYKQCVPHTSLTYRDVAQSNIYMAGFHANLMRDILQNSSNVEFLIVLDRSGYDEPYLSGKGVEHVITISDLKDLEEGVSDRGAIISYNSSTLHIPFIKGFDDLPMEDKIGKYSSMEITKRMVEILERR